MEANDVFYANLAALEAGQPETQGIWARVGVSTLSRKL